MVAFVVAASVVVEVMLAWLVQWVEWNVVLLSGFRADFIYTKTMQKTVV